MRRVPATLLLIAVLVSACGDDDAAPPQDPASIDTCEGAADAMIAVLADTLEIVDALTPEEMALLGSETLPPSLAEVRSRGDLLVARAEVIGCGDDEMSALLSARAERLSSDSVFGQYLIESVRTGADLGVLGE